jgi:hypothetical protein
VVAFSAPGDFGKSSVLGEASGGVNVLNLGVSSSEELDSAGETLEKVWEPGE